MNIEDSFTGKTKEERSIELGFEPQYSTVLLVDILLFTAIIKSCFDTADKKIKRLKLTDY